jgi:hypothetical protein
MEVKKEPKIPMAATRRNLFLRSKMKIHLDSHEIAPDGRATDFFFRKNQFFFDKKS